MNTENKNEFGFLDIEAVTSSDLANADDDQLLAYLTQSPKAIRALAINKAPMAFRAAAPYSDLALEAEKAAALYDVKQRVGDLLAARFKDEGEGPEHIERQIYSGGFATNADQRLMEQFQSAEWPQRAEIMRQFSEKRWKNFAAMIIHKNAPEHLSENFNGKIAANLGGRWHSNDPDAPWTTFAKVEEGLAQLRDEGALSADQLSSFEDFYHQKRDKAPSAQASEAT